MALPLQQIIEEALALSPEEQARLREVLSQPQAKPVRNEAMIRELHGKYAHVLTSSEEFCARKAEDLPLEEHSIG